MQCHAQIYCLRLQVNAMTCCTAGSRVAPDSGVERCFIAGGLTIVGVSIYFNVGGLGASSPRKV